MGTVAPSECTSVAAIPSESDADHRPRDSPFALVLMPLLTGSYHPSLVATSIVVAVLASYTAVSLIGRRDEGRTAATARIWLVAGGSAMGVGIWSMHFIGMLAFHLPIPMAYDVGLTGLSLMIAIALSIFGLWTGSHPRLHWSGLLAGACVMGAGVASMHYVGMEALKMSPGIDYSRPLVVLSVIIAVLASGVALLLLRQFQRSSYHATSLRLCAALVMGLATAGMHYVGMAAGDFAEGSICGAGESGLSSDWLAVAVTLASTGVLGTVLLILAMDAKAKEQTAQLASALAEANQELVQLALHDSLTQLPNRLLLERSIHAAIDFETPFAVLFIDLDGFKAINDLHGHEAGDDLLRMLAPLAEQSLSSRDRLARLGGDEFVALVHSAQKNELCRRAQALLDAFSTPIIRRDLELSVTASIGIARFPRDGRSAAPLLQAADAAMYHAKRLGCSKFSFYEPAMSAGAQERTLLLTQVRFALARNQFQLFFQPKYGSDGSLSGAEALLRWQHPDRGLLTPDNFIDLLEASGSMIDVGRWVLQNVCQKAREWHDGGLPHLTVAVNVSATQFADPHLAEDVRLALSEANLPPSSLILEVTESTAMRDIDSSERVLRQLVGMGIGISIDDFGTGYSSLLYLKLLPATELKIDRAFVSQLESAAEDATIVSAIVTLAQNLHLKVVAEGVETQKQRAFLTELGCDSMQGFLLGKPMPAPEFWAIANQASSVPSPPRAGIMV